MLTVPKEEIVSGNQYWVLEWSDEDGGKWGIYNKGPSVINLQGKYVESESTGFTCEWEESWANMKIWSSGEQYQMAVFPDQESMKQGVQNILNACGDEIYLGLYKEFMEILA